MPSPPRPTFRCLRDDLVDGWGTSSYQRRVILEGPASSPPPLHSLEHPLLRHVVEIFGESDEEIRRETISASANPKCFKAKSGRWRGAVYIDPDDGQAWLIAAGLRREREGTDFYSAFCGNLSAYGAEAYLPTAEDRDRLRKEELEGRLNDWETAVHNGALDALAEAEANATARWQLQPFDSGETIAVFTMKVEILDADEGDDADDGYGEILIEVETRDWGHRGLIDHAEILAMCAIDPRESSWTPGHTNNRVYSMFGSAKEIGDVIAAATSNENIHPREVRPGEYAHYTHKERLMQQYVVGEPAKALCGRFFVPRQVPDDLPKCPECEALYRCMGTRQE